MMDIRIEVVANGFILHTEAMDEKRFPYTVKRVYAFDDRAERDDPSEAEALVSMFWDVADELGVCNGKDSSWRLNISVSSQTDGGDDDAGDE